MADDPLARASLIACVEADYRVLTTVSGRDALAIQHTEDVDLVLCAQRVAEDGRRVPARDAYSSEAECSNTLRMSDTFESNACRVSARLLLGNVGGCLEMIVWHHWVHADDNGISWTLGQSQGERLPHCRTAQSASSLA